jgi:hypothetical protein
MSLSITLPRVLHNMVKRLRPEKQGFRVLNRADKEILIAAAVSNQGILEISLLYSRGRMIGRRRTGSG